jgi:monoamine oxidase
MTDTLILGGGLAGCASALWLADHGHSSMILEARPRLGGRAHSREWTGAGPVEYGGAWIRADHAEMTGLALRLGVTLVPRAPILRHTHFRDGAAHPDPATDMITHQAALLQLLQDATLMDSDSILQGLTLSEYFTHRSSPASLRREVLSWWAISGSGDPDLIAANELITPKLAKGLLIKLQDLAFTVQGGTTALAQAAAQSSGAAVHLGDPVERLADLGSHVQATLASGRILTGKTALVALPLNALSQIRFTPDLTPAQQTLRRMGHAGRALKLLIRARGPEPGHLATGEAAGLRWILADSVLPDGSTLLIAFGLYDETGDPTPEMVRTSLAAAFPGAVYLDHDWHDWCADPFARGTWVSPRLTDLPAYATDHWAPRGRLAFAGSDLYSPEQGWFEGALLTARTATAALTTRLQKA